MKIEIKSDVFDVIPRLKEIDDGYKIMLNLDNGKLELHNEKQTNTYCFTLKENEILPNLINEVLASNIRFIDNIMIDIDNYNAKTELENKNKINDYTSYMSREIFNFANATSKTYNVNNAFKTVWR